MAHVPGTVSTRELLGHLDDLLRPSVIKDYSPNGLQVEGKAVVSRIICAVTATRNVIDAAVAEGADALLVHHGYFWKGEEPRVILNYKGIENMLSFRRISLGPMAWPYYETNPNPALHKTLMDLLKYEMIDRYPNPYLSIWQDPRVKEPCSSGMCSRFSVSLSRQFRGC